MNKTVEVVPLKLGYSKLNELMERFHKLPKWQQDIIRADMESAFESRIELMEQVNRKKGGSRVA